MKARAGEFNPARGDGLVLTLFLAALIVDIGGTFGVKYATATTTLAWVLYRARPFGNLWEGFKLELSLFVAAPALLMAVSVLAHDIDVMRVVRHALFLAPWLILPLLTTLSPRELTNRFLQVMTWASWLTLATFSVLCLLIASDQFRWVEQITKLADSYRVGNIGIKPVQHLDIGAVPTAYFGWSMFLIPACVLAFGLMSRRLFSLLAATVAVLSAGLLAGTVLGCSISAFLRPGRLRRRLVVLLAVLGAVCLAAVAAGYGPFIAWLASKFTPAWRGTAQKLAQVETIRDVMAESPWSYLVGMGIGSSFYSDYLGREIVGIEIGQVDMARQFGLPYATAFFAYVGWLCLRLFRTPEPGLYWGAGLLAFFVATATNPFLLSPVFITVLALARGVLYHGERPSGTAGGMESS